MRELREDAIPAYTIVRTEDIYELNSTGYLLRHKKTGANVALIVNDDKNKVFNIGFRTPPENDTGVAHILEHSVLCGSKKFPVKNPFEELVQGSLYTFLNAMTYPDKTLYPVASCNDKDFKNLMDVYLDAVFNPNIYDQEEIFKQEGWHYELTGKNEKLFYNGVVYNEMKGAFSTPESILSRSVLHELFPDTCYGYESGGNPVSIPKLSYKEFLDFHRKYYHPSNSFIYLYGDMDMAEKLDFIDKEYLCRYDRLEIDSTVKNQKPFETVKISEGVYPVGNEEAVKDKGFLSYSTVAGTALDPELYYGFTVLSYALLLVPGAPLKQALIDAGIGKAIVGGYNKSFLQNQFTITAKEADTDRREEFVSIIESVLQDIVRNGIDKKSLKAALNIMEFQYREADFGSYPRGLFYCLYSMDSWAYDENEPFLHIKAGDTFKELNRKADTGYFEELIDKYILKNTHKVIYALKPQKGLGEVQEREVEDELTAYRKSLDETQLETIIKETEALKEYQSEPSPREDIEKIPLIGLEDIEKKPRPYNYRVREEEARVVFSDIFSNGIGYVTASFDCKYVPAELIPYIGFLENILGNMDTANYQYSDLNNEINIHSGGCGISAVVYNMNDDNEGCQVRLNADIKVLYKELEFAFKILEEMLIETNVENEKRLREIVAENRAMIRSMIISSGDSVALRRGLSYVNQAGAVNDMFMGIGAYEFFDDLYKNFDYKKVVENLKKVMRLIFNRENLILGFTADEEGYEIMKRKIHYLTDKLYDDKLIEEERNIRVEVRNEGIIIPSPVSYVARMGSFKRAGFQYTGTMRCLKNLLDYGYLWQEIRIKGGAYGVSSTYQQNSGNMAYMSYRDPNVAKTNEAFTNVPQYLENFQADTRELQKYIIGAISGLDVPLNPKAEGNVAFGAYICGKTDEDQLREREEVLNLNVEQIRETGKIVGEVLSQGYICAVGNKEKIQEAKELFKEVREIFD